MTRQTNTNTPKTLQGQYAGFISRFLAFFVDVLVIIAVITVVGISMDIITRFFQLEEVIGTMMSSTNTIGNIARFIAFLGSVAAISFGYFIIIWTVTAGQSVGKVLLGVRIVPLDGSKITFWHSTIRYVAFLFSALIFFIGLLWVLVSDSRQGWHDKVARTCVIYDWPARENDGVIGTIHSRVDYFRHTRRRLRSRKTDGTQESLPQETEPLQHS